MDGVRMKGATWWKWDGIASEKPAHARRLIGWAFEPFRSRALSIGTERGTMSERAEVVGGPFEVEECGALRFSSIIGALSYALDLTEGALPGHAMRSCLLGMRIGTAMGLNEADLSSLYYALLLKDAGCSSNASRMHQIVGGDEIHAKALTKTLDYERIEWKQFHFLLKHVHSQLKPGERMKAVGSLVKNSSENA